MTTGFKILVFGLAAAATVYACAYFAGTQKSRQWRSSSQPELTWIKEEYRLNDQEFARLTELHNAYLPKCAEHCRRIAEMNGELEQALDAASSLTPQIEALLAMRAQMRADCQGDMLQHFFEVSRTMPEEQGRRYLAWVREQTCLRESVVAEHPAMTNP